jgi:hypothetical protein
LQRLPSSVKRAARPKVVRGEVDPPILRCATPKHLLAPRILDWHGGFSIGITDPRLSRRSSRLQPRILDGHAGFWIGSTDSRLAPRIPV